MRGMRPLHVQVWHVKGVASMGGDYAGGNETKELIWVQSSV